MHLKIPWYSHDCALIGWKRWKSLLHSTLPSHAPIELSLSLPPSSLNLKSRRLPSTAHTSRISCVNQFEIRLFFAVSTSFPELLARLVTIRPVELLECWRVEGKKTEWERVGKRGISRRLDQQVFETLIMEGITEDLGRLEYSRDAL